MILTDDNFGTLVHAVELGRSVYEKIVSYVRYQMTQLLALVLLFLAATRLRHQRRRRDDAADGAVPELLRGRSFPVVVIMLDPGDPEVMHRPPRDPKRADHQPAGRRAVGRLRRRAVPGRADPAGARPGRPAHGRRPAPR